MKDDVELSNCNVLRPQFILPLWIIKGACPMVLLSSNKIKSISQNLDYVGCETVKGLDIWSLNQGGCFVL